MARPFDITTPNDTASTAAGGAVTLVFTVINTTSKPLRGSLRAKALDSGQAAWLTVKGDAERDFQPGLAQQVEVVAKVPAGTAAAPFRVRLDAMSVANPDDDFTEGPTIRMGIKEAPPPPPPPSKLGLWLIIALVVVALIGVVTWLVLRKKPSGGTTIPAGVVGKPYADAEQQLQALGLAVTKATTPITDTCGGNVVSTAPPPGSPASGAVVVTVGALASGPDTCKKGFVWREAYSGDVVCVTPEARAQAAQDNSANPTRTESVVGTPKDIEEIQRTNPRAAVVPKGDLAAIARFDTRVVQINPGVLQSGGFWITRCKAGYIERRANANDHVCVTSQVEQVTAAENDQANSHRACPKQ